MGSERFGRSRATAAILALLAAICAGCGGEKESAEAPAAPRGETDRSEVELGPVRVVAEVGPKKVRLSDEPILTLTIDSAIGVKVEKPPFGEAIGGFVIRDFRESLPEVRDGREILRQRYVLEPTRTGELSIFPIAVRFTDERPDGDGKEHTLETEALNVEVESVLGEELPTLEALRPPAGPVTLPEPEGGASWWALPAGILVLAVPALLWLRRRRRRSDEPEKRLSPREQAYLELQRLLEADLEVKPFYVELTGIVRRYIERTEGIHAPEQTTEEFLREIGAGAVFDAEERDRLRQFLESADLVKFAKHEPRREDIEESFRRAKAFLGLATEEGMAA